MGDTSPPSAPAPPSPSLPRESSPAYALPALLASSAASLVSGDDLKATAADILPPGPCDNPALLDAGSSGLNLGCDGFEMSPITPAGHRRRRSSLMNPATPATSSHPGPSRHKSQSSRNQTSGQDEPKISEEGDGSASVWGAGDKARDSFSDEDLHDDEEAGLTSRDKRRKQQKRRRNTMLDRRVARERRITASEKKEADQSVAKNILVNGVLIGLWYLFSLCISLYNKWMFDKNRLNFPFPLFTTSLHMIVQFVFASLTLYFIPSLRPQRPEHGAQPARPLMTKMFYLTRIAPCGAATGLDIGLGNTSLKFITLTFYTMCKSSSLGFVLIFAFLFRLESPTWRLIAIIATMTAGVVMMVAGEVEFKLGGFVLVISAAFFSGFRWALTQILLLRNPATSNPFSSIFFLAPVMFMSLIVIAIPAEGFSALIDGIGLLVDEWGALLAPLLLLFPGTLAFLMTVSEFALLQRTSVVTLSIAGIFKEAVTISAAAIIFDDRLTPVNFAGLLVTLAAIAAYNWIKISSMRREAQVEAHQHCAVSTDSGSNGFSSPCTSGGEDGFDGDEQSGLLRNSTDAEDALFGERRDSISPVERQCLSSERTRNHEDSHDREI